LVVEGREGAADGRETPASFPPVRFFERNLNVHGRKNTTAIN
jgi:hypothetical protein